MRSKQQQIIESALALFVEQGIHAVGINEVIKRSGVAKKTLYNYFSSKDDLILATLELRDQRFMGWIEQELASVEPGKPALLQIFYALDRWFNSQVEQLGPFYGCFFINASAEFSNPQSPVYLACKAHKDRLRDLFGLQVAKLGLPEKQAESLLDAICALKEGAITQARVQGDLQAAKKLLPVVNHLLDG